MRRACTLLVVLLLVALTSSAQTAQRTGRLAMLRTDAEVLALIRPLGWEYAEATLGDSVRAVYKPYRNTPFAVRKQTWFTADFDGNGLTDLLVLARRKDIPLVFCLLDMGNDSLYVVRNFYNAGQHRSPVARVIRRKGQDLLLYADFARSRSPHGRLRGRRTLKLAYVSGGFVEFNPQPAEHHIQRITFESHNVYHQAVQTRIVITPDSAQFWERTNEILNPAKITVRQQRIAISAAQLGQLTKLLAYLNFPQLQNHYGGYHFSHHESVTLTIVYDKGEQKVIEDTNGIGTMGLRWFYRLLYSTASPQ